MNIKDFYSIKGETQRIKFSLKERLGMLPQNAWKEIYQTLTDQSDSFGKHRKRFSRIIKDEVLDISLYEAAVICKAV